MTTSQELAAASRVVALYAEEAAAFAPARCWRCTCRVAAGEDLCEFCIAYLNYEEAEERERRLHRASCATA